MWGFVVVEMNVCVCVCARHGASRWRWVASVLLWRCCFGTVAGGLLWGGGVWREEEAGVGMRATVRWRHCPRTRDVPRRLRGKRCHLTVRWNGRRPLYFMLG